MTEPVLSMVFSFLCLALSVVFMWSTLVVLVGLIKPERKHPEAGKKLKFAVVICARNEESVINLPISSVIQCDYPRDLLRVIVLADNCEDATAEKSLAAGAEVWEKSTPSSGKGDVLAWGFKRLYEEGGFDAIAVFDADNVIYPGWFSAVSDALQDGEMVVTGRRLSSNPRANVISGWYSVYWGMMNELSNRVRTNLGLSGKLTGTGFAFNASVVGASGWNTCTMVEDVEFTVQSNLRGCRVAYVPQAEYADEQPVTIMYMWRQLRRWATGGWQVVRCYFLSWIKKLLRNPSLRLFDSFFAILTGMSVAFILLFNVLSLIVRVGIGFDGSTAIRFFLGVFLFVFIMGWFTAAASVALSPRKSRPSWKAVLTFPIFSLILSASVIFTLVRPTRHWKPIPHGKQL